jgi:hypothetical protein
MNNWQIKGVKRSELNDNKQAIACMNAYIEPLQEVARQFSVNCSTDCIITYYQNTFETETKVQYTLPINLTGIVQQNIELTFQHRMDGPQGDVESIECNLDWESIIIEEGRPLDIKYLEGSKVEQLQAPNTTLQHSFTLYRSTAYDTRTPLRDKPTELNKFREAAWVTVAMMRRIFLINRVHYAPIAHVIHPIRKDVGLFNHIPSDLRRRIVQMYINSLRTDMTNALQSIKDSASLADGPLPDPF